MNQYHVVAITTKAYHRLASYEERKEAVADFMNRSLRSYSCVLRDGHTGKRYTQAECASMKVGA